MDNKPIGEYAAGQEPALSALMTALSSEKEFRNALSRAETALLASGEIRAVTKAIKRLEIATIAADQGQWSVKGELPEYAARAALTEAISEAWQILSQEQRRETLRAIDVYRIPGETVGITNSPHERAAPAPLPSGNTMRFVLETLRSLTKWAEKRVQAQTNQPSASNAAHGTTEQL